MPAAPASAAAAGTTIIADPLEQFIAAGVLHRLESPRLPEAITRTPNGADGSEWQAEVERTQAKLDELAELWAEGAITRGEWLKARAPIEKRQTLAKKKLAALNRATALVPFIGDVKRVREQWETMTLSRQHEIVAALLDHVVVGPAARRGYNRFDESRLQPVWRV